MTLTKKLVSQYSSNIKPSSDLCMRQANIFDVSELTDMITSPAASLQPELNAETQQHLSG
eukprot:4565672-Pyramimonas_sp.AAC.2